MSSSSDNDDTLVLLVFRNVCLDSEKSSYDNSYCKPLQAWHHPQGSEEVSACHAVVVA